jgi:transcription initiation factor TFIIB
MMLTLLCLQTSTGVLLTNPMHTTGKASESAKPSSHYAKAFTMTSHYQAGRNTDSKDRDGATHDADLEDNSIPDLNLKLLCPECNEDPPNLVEVCSSGDVVCGACGLVVSDRTIDMQPECESCLEEVNDLKER